MNRRFEARKVHATAIEKRFRPDYVEKPFVVWDTWDGRPVGRRYRTLTGAQMSAKMRNKAEGERT